MTDPAAEPTAMISTDDGATTSGDEAGPSKSGDEKAKGAPRARRVRNNKKGAGRGGGGPAASTTNAPAGGAGKTDHWRVVKPAFREWLTNITSRDEYNGLGVLERSALLRDFGVAQKGLAPAAVAVATPAKVTAVAPGVVEPDKPAASAE